MLDDSLFPLLLVLRYMHILGAIMLMGGSIFLRFAFVPTVAGTSEPAKGDLHERIRSRWAKLVMVAAALLLISGIANLGLAARYEYEPVFGMSYHMLVGIKFLLALPIFFIASLLAGRSAAAKKVQASAQLWMNVTLALALVMVLMGGLLKFVPRQPKADQPQAAVIAPPLPRQTLPSQKLPSQMLRSQMLPLAAQTE